VAVLEIMKYRKLSGAISPASEVSQRSSSGSGIFFSYLKLYAKFQQNLWHAVHQVADLTWNDPIEQIVEEGGGRGKVDVSYLFIDEIRL